MRNTVVLVDDGNALEYHIPFISREGYIVRWYQDYEQAFCALSRIDYQIAFIDAALPDGDGKNLVRLSKECNPDVPVIGISGYAAMKVARVRPVQSMVFPLLMCKHITSGHILTISANILNFSSIGISG